MSLRAHGVLAPRSRASWFGGARGWRLRSPRLPQHPRERIAEIKSRLGYRFASALPISRYDEFSE